uniref:Uncharacterized protein n=1 Tax=Tanacetum cinerariifolium TaxID=118510 RepID=A0A6L2J253_TANCI|nr:hypothetical protein [Tanacetum cinerariifolium]
MEWREIVDFGLQPWRVLGTTTVYGNLSLVAMLDLADVCTFLDLTLMPLHILEMKEKGGGVRVGRWWRP